MSVEGRQVEEAMLAVLHTVLLHRSTGKFHYKKEGTYSIGTVGTQDVDCDFIDFTYVRVSSEELDRALRKVVGEFKVGTSRWRSGRQVDLECPSTLACSWTSLPFLSVPVRFFHGPRNRRVQCSLRGEGLWAGAGVGKNTQGRRAGSPCSMDIGFPWVLIAPHLWAGPSV